MVLATYNHAGYVGDAIASVLSQETARPFELIISEDCSTDGTREIVEEAARRDPRVRLLLSPVNLRSNEVVARGIRAARGRYICLLDGDDRWIVADKLERQAAVLDAEPSASACFHNALIVRGIAREPSDERWTPGTQPNRVNQHEVWRGNPFATSAGMLRRDALAGLGEWYAGFFPVTDWPLYILCAEHGDLLFIDEPVAAYRLHEAGLFSALPDRTKLHQISRFFPNMDRATGGKWHRSARRGRALYLLEWAEAYLAAGDRPMARAATWEAVRSGAIAYDKALFARWRRVVLQLIVSP